MRPIDAVAHRAQTEWTHQILLDCRPPTGLARAFVSHHLVAHRLFHLVDVGRVVAGQMAGNPFMRARMPLTLTMSRTAAVLRLTVDAGCEPEGPDSLLAPVETWHGARAVGMLSLEWGVGLDAGRPTNLWATLDARHHREAVAAVASTMRFPGQHDPLVSVESL